MISHTGLSEHTLRYYERIGLLGKVHRDRSSGHRRYTPLDMQAIHAMACLRATGMSIEDMRKFRDLALEGQEGAQQQVALFEAHRTQLEREIARKQLHLQYLDMKVEFWKAAANGDEAAMQEFSAAADHLARQFQE